MAVAATNLRFFPLPNNTSVPKYKPSTPIKIKSFSCPLRSTSPNLSQSLTVDDNNNGGGFGKGGGGRGGGNGGDAGGDGDRSSSGSINPIAMFIEGWRSRVAADPEFTFKVLMEELVGVSATAVGDMATRPNFGLGELDFVLSTLIVGSIVNFTLMYLLAPTAAAASPSAAAASLPSYIFEPGPYSLASRAATFVYKGVIFAAVGFASGLAGTAISNGLVALREGGKGEEEEATGKKKKKKRGPKTVLNAATWAAHMGLSSNLRYQTLNGVEFVMARSMPSALFKAAVVVLRCLNNVAGGMTFVMLGRLMGSQKPEEDEELQVDLKVE